MDRTMRTPPKDDQIKAMLDGNVYELLSHYGTAHVVDFRPYLTVDRSDVESFLHRNPEAAMSYFEKASAVSPESENKIERSGDAYRVLWVDHGQVRSARHFTTLAEAVAEHLLVAHGMY